MKTFLKHTFDPNACLNEVTDLRSLLNAKAVLSERNDILPFFRARPNLSAFLGSYFPKLRSFDRLAYEYQLFGDLSCDLVVGDSTTGWYCFIEFENADEHSIFQTKRPKTTPEWSTRFEHGFSQIIDWFWKLEDFRHTADLQSRFERNLVRYYGMLVLGRDRDLEYREKLRKEWRLEKVVIDSKQIYCVTFDELCDDLENKLKAMHGLTVL